MVTLLLAGGIALSQSGTMAAADFAGRPQAPSPAPGLDVTTLGPQVGDVVPDFTLPDQQGRTRTLSSLMGPNGLVLVFVRSADW